MVWIGMWHRWLCLVVLVLACGKDSKQADNTGSASAGARPDKVLSDKSAADVMNQSVAEAKARAAATTSPAPPPPVPAAPPVDPMPPETPPTTSETPAGSATAPAAEELKVGDRVMAKWTNGSWYPGKIVAITDGKYDINFDDGDKSRGLPASKVRKRSAGSSGGGRASSTSNDAPCPGPGITRRCNGRCVNIQENDNHCGGCNNRCPAGKHCDGHLFCRDADGNL